MPTLLLCARRELAPGAGYVVPVDDRDRFRRALPHANVVDIEANHLTIAAHPDAVAAIATFFSGVLGQPPAD